MKSISSVILLVLLTLPAAPPLAAAPPSGPNAWCGTDPASLEVALARHAALERRLERERRGGRIPLKSAPNVFQAGDIAVMEDDGTLVSQPNEFDLQGRGMQFLRRPKGMSVVRTNLGFKQLIGDRLTLFDDDSVRVSFPAGFEFPIGDRVYTSVWVNSNGNLTFGAPEPFAIPTLNSLVTGPPRIAALLTDLDPSTAGADGGVYVSFPPGRVRVTYRRVPQFGTNLLSTVQVTLFETGRVTVVFGDEVEATNGIVGVSAFGDGALHVMDYSEELPFRPPQRVAIAEEFHASRQRNDLVISQTFFEHFRDVYDHVIVWLDFREILGPGVGAFELNVKNTIRGIGLGTFDRTSFFGSPGRLESFVQMGSLVRFPDDPDQDFFGTNSTMDLLGHETGHRWLAFVRMIDRNGQRSNALLGRQLAHWSFFMDSEGSVVEGNDWTDQGGGTFVSSERTTSRFSELDRYIMGLIPAAAVPDFFVIEPTVTARSPADNPIVGAIAEGERVDISVNDVIAAEGARIPAAADAPKSFRMAFVLVGAPGEPVSQESIDKLESIRQRWLEFFPEATGFRGEVRTTLFPK